MLQGLSTEEAARRLAQYGPNTTTNIGRLPPWLRFLMRFRSPLILLLLAASALAALTGDRVSFVLIFSMLVLSVSLDFVQEERADKTVEALRRSVALRTTVVRNGQKVPLPVLDIVPGDVVFLSAGDLVPADGKLEEDKDIYVNQALLTGESFPVEKDTAGDAEMFMGTSIVSGTGLMRVTVTGKRSRLGGLAGALAKPRPPTAFETGMESFGVTILRLAVGLVLLALLVNLYRHRPLFDSFLFSLALAVGLTPELLPVLMTLNLARGAVRMAKERVIVKRLPSMHNLGAMDILCTDKTGTLTEAIIEVVSAVDAKGRESERVFALAHVNSTFETGIHSPLDEAILAHGKRSPEGWSKIDEAPFDFERRRISVLAEREGRRFLIVKGAPEDIIRLSDFYEEGSAKIPLDDGMRRDILARFEAMGERGLRVLAVAFREEPETQEKALAADEADLVFAGFVAFADPPKQSTGAALRALQRDGVAVKVVTGDNERVTRHVCAAVGFDPGAVLAGGEIEKMTDEALGARAVDTHVFCRVTPQQKSRIIGALKRRGHTVGFLGDGVNDAPALHQADVGLSVDTATDVAQAAADIILLDKDLMAIHSGVVEGRRAVENTEKYIFMASSSNFGNMVSMAASSLFLPFLPMLPIQILLNNFLYDLSQTALSFDTVDKEALSQPVRWDLPRIRRYMWVLGPLSSLFDFATFYVLLGVFHADEAMFHTGWFVESLVTQVLIVLSVRTHKPVFRSKPHPALAVAAFTTAFIAVSLPFTPAAGWLGFVPLSAAFFGFLGCALVLYFALVEAVKSFLMRPHWNEA